MLKQKKGLRRWYLKMFGSIAIVCVIALFVLMLFVKVSMVCGCYNPIYDMTATAHAENPETATEEFIITITALP